MVSETKAELVFMKYNHMHPLSKEPKMCRKVKNEALLYKGVIQTYASKGALEPQ